MKPKLQKFLKASKKYLKIIIPVILVIAIAAVFLLKRQFSSKNEYTTETAQIRDVATYLTFTGNVEATNDATIIPKVAKTVTAVNVSIGDEVKKGDVIATLDDTQIQRSIKSKEASISSSELNNYYSIRDKQKTYDNYKESLENGENATLISAQKEVSNALKKYESAKETYERDKLELENNMDSSMINSNRSVENAKTSLEEAKKAYDDNEAKIRGYETGVDNAESTYGENSQQAETAKKNLESLEEKRDSLQQAIDKAQTSYDNAVNDLLMSYYNTNLNIESEYKSMQDAYQDYQDAVASYERTQKNVYQTLQDYADDLEKTQATSNTTTATSELEALNEQLEDYKIIAPIDGVITVLNINVGDSVTTTTTAAEVTNYDQMKVQIKIDEDSVSSLENGTQMDITVDAVGKTYQGTIQNLSKKATVSNNVAYFTADVVFEAGDEIRSGLSAEVTHLLNGVEDVLSVSMSALNYNDDNTAYVLVGNSESTAKQCNVTLGISNGTYVEIKDGISEGDTVLVKKSSTSTALMNMGMGGGMPQGGGAPGGSGGGMPQGGGAPGGSSGGGAGGGAPAGR